VQVEDDMKTTRQLPKKTDVGTRPQLYRLKVTLLNSKPPIWRRLRVHGDTTLAGLHAILQVAMGWLDSHLHTFEVHGITYADPDPEWHPPVSDERGPTLTGLGLVTGSRFTYEYDMGDGWRHEIVVEAVTDAETARPRRAACIAGRRACPPEDVGGIGGYAYFLEAIRDSNHKEHKDMMDWIGKEFDPEAFSVAETDQALEEL